MLKIKRNADDSVGIYKAKLVAKGFNQKERINYGETVNPVVKPTTVRLVLANCLFWMKSKAIGC